MKKLILRLLFEFKKPDAVCLYSISCVARMFWKSKVKANICSHSCRCCYFSGANINLPRLDVRFS
jgi:hypothetical protein